MIQTFVDAEFKARIPPLAPEELTALEGSVIREGCRDALVIWKERQILVDGHNRYDICTRHNIPYRIFEKSFKDKDEVLDWIDANQLARRNLTPDQMSLLRGRRYNYLKSKQGGDHKSNGQNARLINQSEALATQYGVDEKTIRRDAQFAEAVETLAPYVPDIERRVFDGDVTSKTAVITAAKVVEDLPIEQKQETAEVIISKPHVSNNGGDNEWYTPQEYITAARSVMGDIDLDPASTETANKVIMARRFYTQEENGLAQKWFGKIWLNPPYAQPLIRQFCEKLVSEIDAQNIKEAIILVNNATETQWFQLLASKCSAICFPSGRVRFWAPDKVSQPLQGQAVIYFGANRTLFYEYFKDFGVMLAT